MRIVSTLIEVLKYFVDEDDNEIEEVKEIRTTNEIYFDENDVGMVGEGPIDHL